jgi:predicted NAD-dependent protein-ADP-ribosyltransferase YbiA (DUF1768 family)
MEQLDQDNVISSSIETTKDSSINDEQTIWFKSSLANGYAYLSNFFPHITPAARQAFDDMIQEEINHDDNDFSIIIDDKRYATVEHYYQSQKYIEHYPEQAEAIRTEAKTALQSKEMNVIFKDKYPSLSVFDKENTMLRGLRAKFTQNKLLNKLLKQTAGKTLHELPGKTDSRWSNDENLLGRLLMQIRDEL